MNYHICDQMTADSLGSTEWESSIRSYTTYKVGIRQPSSVFFVWRFQTEHGTM